MTIGTHCWLRLRSHRWRLRAVDPLLITTNLLYRCERCGRLRARRIAGAWEGEPLDVPTERHFP